MFPTLTPTTLPATGDALKGTPSQPTEDTTTGAEDGGLSRGTESKSFSAVLLALASLGPPLHAMPPATPPAATTPAPGFAPFDAVFMVDHGAIYHATKVEETADSAWTLMNAIGGADGIVRTPLGDGYAEDEAWVAFNVLGGGVVLGEVVDFAAIDGLSAARPMDEGALAEMLTTESKSGKDSPHPGSVISLQVAFGNLLDLDEVAGMDLALPTLETEAEGAMLQAVPQVGPPFGVQTAQESPPLDQTMLNRLSREFVSRLENVADRMFTEYGLQLDVVEGYRSQNRQEALFAQGRTAPGNVVTWTTNSLHTSGAAADVFVDGAPVTPEQAAILARVAAEEGLKTLYPYDSGHIQLDGGRRGGAIGPEGPLDRQPAANRAGGATPPPPGVAQPAPVARVARPARPGGMALNNSTGEGPRTGANYAPDANGLVGLPPEEGDPTSPSLSGASGSTGATPADGRGVLASGLTPAPMITAALPGSLAAGDARASPLSPIAPLDPTAFDASNNVSAYRRLHLPIEGVSGSASLDIGVRPGSVDAFLNVSDPQLAEELRRSLHELRQVLSDRGIEARGLGVRLIADGRAEPAPVSFESVSRSSAGEGASGQSTTQGERERGARYRDNPEGQDPSRQPRREHPDKETD